MVRRIAATTPWSTHAQRSRPRHAVKRMHAGEAVDNDHTPARPRLSHAQSAPESDATVMDIHADSACGRLSHGGPPRWQGMVAHHAAWGSQTCIRAPSRVHLSLRTSLGLKQTIPHWHPGTSGTRAVKASRDRHGYASHGDCWRHCHGS